MCLAINMIKSAHISAYKHLKHFFLSVAKINNVPNVFFKKYITDDILNFQSSWEDIYKGQSGCTRPLYMHLQVIYKWSMRFRNIPGS